MTQKRRRPIWVWAIAIFYFCTGTMTLLSFLHILATPVDLPPEELAAIRFQAKVWTLFGLLPALNIAAAVSIFKMRRIAFYLFSWAMAAGLANIGLQLLFFDLASRIQSGPGLVGTVIGYGITFTVCIYTYRLKKSGALT
jgi:hypothetical protein